MPSIKPHAPDADRGRLVFDAAELQLPARPVIAAMTLTVEPGQAWFVLGPNGAGKSTLLHAALGVLAPTRGRVRREGSFRERGAVGVVPQRSAALDTLPSTVTEIVNLGLCGLRLSRAERAERIAHGLGRVGLTHLSRRAWNALSEGQRQRALLARALARRPRLLVLDEPTASLDPHTALALWQLCDRLRTDDGLAILCATHDLRAAQRFATHTVLLTPPSELDGPSHAHCAEFATLAATGAFEHALGVTLTRSAEDA